MDFFLFLDISIQRRTRILSLSTKSSIILSFSCIECLCDMEERVKTLEDAVVDIKSLLVDIQSKLTAKTSDRSTNSTSTGDVANQTTNNTSNNADDSAVQSNTNEYTGASAHQFSPAEDIQATYASIKASVQAVRLPPDLTLGSSGATGLKKGEAQIHTVINKVARITETIFKVLKSKEEPYDDVFSCALALMNILQDEQAAILVQSSFDPTVARFFRNLRRGGGLTPDALEDLRSAASIAAAYRPQQQQQQQSRGSGRGPSAFQFQQRDFFGRAAGRGFPNQRGARRGAHHSAMPERNPEQE